MIAAFAEISEGVIVDVTAGGAGHSAAILRALPGVRLMAFDRDPRAVAAASAALEPFGERASVQHASFAEVGELLDAAGIARIDGLSARDAIHLATMRRHNVDDILSFDTGFDRVAGIRRRPDAQTE